MSTTTIHPARPRAQKQNGPKGPRRPNHHHIHRNPLPVEVYPLPPLIPHNPLSLVAIALSYLTQILAPPPRKTYKGYFSSATSSIHITDEETQRALWEMGFFGKGSLSRSEPTWLENQRRAGVTAEENTDKRRFERRQFKLDRAKQEQEEISVQLSREIPRSVPSTAEVVKTNGHDFDGIAGVLQNAAGEKDDEPDKLVSSPGQPPDGNVALPLKLTESRADGATKTESHPTGDIAGFDEWKRAVDANGLPTPPPTSTCSESSLPETRPVKKLQRQKTVRFSPTIEAREFDLSSPVISPIKAPGISPVEEKEQPLELVRTQNKEHLHISIEEAFFLSYGLGVLNIYSDDSDTILPTISLLSLFRRHSYTPHRSLSVPSEPDDPFMLSYVVYHHFRSMGWVVRSGVKFGVNYLLYNRGPAFSHAEFSVIVLPSYTDEYWNGTEEQERAFMEKSKKSWWWLHGINRVQAQVQKHLVLCYVDVPAPLPKEKGADVDVGTLLSRYNVRDVNLKRWTPNRSRD